MSTNSLRNTGTTVAPGPGHWLDKCKILLWLALPLALAVGCASNPNRTARADAFFTDNPAPTAAPVFQGEAANRVVEREVFYMFLADTNTSQSVGFSVNSGVVTLAMWPTMRIWMGGTTIDAVEQQRIVDQTWGLAGVTRVQDGQGVDLSPTTVPIVAVAR